ncbi:MAG: hypothetical protein KJ626_11670 [Verrucomicrobia bacterium]|nr:hypothetical protein [Verrucomicrobiota bacterium]
MKTEQILKEALKYEGTQLPAAIREHFEKHPDDLKAYERLQAVRQLLALKRYEQPEEKLEERSRRDVRRAILAGKHSEDDVPSLLPLNLVPILRYGLATAFVGLLAFHVVSVFQPGTQPSAFSAPAAGLTAELSPGSAMTNLAAAEYRDPAEPLVRVPSNRRPGGIQYGTMPSDLVDY